MTHTDIHDLPTVTQADVYKDNRLAGYLERTTDGIQFGYLREYLESGGPPVATTLPLRDEPLVTLAGAVPPFFAGLLPEGRRLNALRHAVKTSSDDELSLLLAIGADAIGDVSVIPKGHNPQPVPTFLEIDDPHQADFTEVLAASLGTSPDRVGIPGVQDKVSARMISMPVRGSTGPGILKLNPPEFPSVVENEAFFLEAARRSGIDVAPSALIHDGQGVPGLLVQRFDRVVTDTGEFRSLPAEDACQVLGRYPAAKYSLTSEEIAAGLISVTRAEAVAAMSLLRQFVFAYLTANGDAHAKNFSILGSVSGEWKISPAYDLPTSYLYGDYTLALSIGGRRREDVTRATFADFGQHLKLKPRATHRVLDELIERTDLWINDLDTLPFATQQVRKLKRAIQYRRKQLTARH
ncbi:type II toxin-antitoxin system HipA family toxin [Stackebrandtia nassauensis]|uniref:HipA N-terminal domain protein n=1 Tax=Stackebrandtia nassauensis (strain DSM 44728 / CIP 108903 / NRRL B-16338 / NBRC 102104 / LLR-40K-21) TaxID=446470 RepID=D3Q431_STANL|nr:HipA domain-containing protein [Stackebrandtia nassauensis]ADD45916.1 HipA N-terminal domain protein [Stackebrandtia nassauensis DSM 44728]